MVEWHPSAGLAVVAAQHTRAGEPWIQSHAGSQRDKHTSYSANIAPEPGRQDEHPNDDVQNNTYTHTDTHAHMHTNFANTNRHDVDT